MDDARHASAGASERGCGLMRSKELADLTGVTVRALRHYHQMGVLPEPPRSHNGYRDYGAVDMARVLRIKRLASLGFSLQQVKDMLDRDVDAADGMCSETDAAGAAVHCESSDTDEVLAALDAELAERITRLQEKRRVVAELRARCVDPDVPPAFAEHVARLKHAGASERFVAMERAGLLLVDRLLAGDGARKQAVVRFFVLLDEMDAVGEYVRLNEKLCALAPDAPAAARQRLADAFVALMVPLLERGRQAYGWRLSAREIAALSCAPSPEGPPPCDAVGAVLDMYDAETLNEAQRDMSERVAVGIARLMGA